MIVCPFHLDCERVAKDATYSHRVSLDLCESQSSKGSDLLTGENQKFSFVSLPTDGRKVEKRFKSRKFDDQMVSLSEEFY